MKRSISLLLALCLFLGVITPVLASSEIRLAAPAAEVQPTAEENLAEESYVQGVVLFALDHADRFAALADLLSAFGVSEVEPLFTENGEAVGFGERNEVWYRASVTSDVGAAVNGIAALEGVVCAEPEYIYTSDNYGSPTEIEMSKDWAYKKLHKHENKYWWKDHFNHDEAPGFGTVVAVIDTGVDYTHEDLASSMWVNVAEMYGAPGVDDDGNGYIDDIHGVDVTAYGQKAGNPMDDHGHGTHVAGIIAMSSNGVGGVGLAYGAKIMAIKAGMSTGTLASTDIAKAINYAHMMGADVINMSFGGSGKSYLVESALESAFADCVLVASAGNDGLPTTDADPALYPKRVDIYPAGYTYVLGVMATDEKGDLAGFSNWDYKIGQNCEYEMTAPGVGIHSTLPGNRYAEWNGTSMAAPFVAAAAAIVRSHYSDKDMYSSRFIMGQLSAATKDRTAFTAPKGEYYSYPALNVYDSVFYLPTPDIFVKDTFLMDNVMAGTPNDGDAIIDAGETVDLGVLVRNRWGLTGNITVRADAISVGGVANPYITFLTDTVTLAPAGTFQEVNNGFVYDDSYLTAVSNPIRFAVAQNTPNDTEICINITVTTTNGADAADRTLYTAEEKYTFRVQAGKSLKGTISQDMTLTNNYLWIVENSVLIEEGVTVTVEPGTKIQFYSSDYENAYGGLTMPLINNMGTFKAIGTEEAPIEMFPGKGFEADAVQIFGEGVETLRYCEIINPMFVNKNDEYDSTYAVDEIDHCVLVQNYTTVYYRKLDHTGSIKRTNDVNRARVRSLTNTQVYAWDFGQGYYTSNLCVGTVRNCLFDSCRFEILPLKDGYRCLLQNNVFMGSGGDMTDYGRWQDISYNSFVLDGISAVKTYEGASGKYVAVKLVNHINPSWYYSIVADIARSLGGTLACMNDVAEEKFLCKEFAYSYIGYSVTDTGFAWADGNAYTPKITNLAELDGIGSPCAYLALDGVKFVSGMSYGNQQILLELPNTLSDEEIIAGIQGFDTQLWMQEQAKFQNTNNAYINPVLNHSPETWARIKANLYNSSYLPNYATNNYWGTENQMLINQMIIDADDYAGTYQDIIHDPILTLDSPSLAEIYPFVTKVYLTDKDGNVTQNVQPGQEYSVHVHFNRDMDMSTQPTVSYGGETPYTDYTVNGAFVSPREWVGTTKISPILNSGTMYFRTKGGCAADDHWLECGEDVLRFSFNVTTTGVLAMMLNAEGGTNKVELSWAQNDYDTLAGYNIYRSTSPDGYFEKVNVSIVTGTEYTDTDVQPGVTYYYYFKVVNTEGNEEENVSNTASAAPRDNIFPELQHNPVENAKAGAQITVSATATDNIAVAAVNLYYRKAGEANYQMKTMLAASTPNLYVSTIPASAITGAGVEYYVTVTDADGNVTHSGTALIPHRIAVNSSPYISGITPSKISIEGGKTITVLGGNFTADLTLKVGSVAVTEFSVVNEGQINFVAPAMSGGSYALTLSTADGTVIVSPTPLSYSDASSIVQIPTNMLMTSGEIYTIPLYVSAAGEVIALHAEIDLPDAYFSSVAVEKADVEASFQLQYTHEDGVLKIGCISTSNMIVADQPLVNIIVTPNVITNTVADITLHDVTINGSAVSNVIGGSAVIKPCYKIMSIVKYFMGDKYVSGVTVTASGKNAVTDENGQAVLIVGDQTVTVSASGGVPANAVTAHDASLVLQSAVGKITLSDYQKLAADTDGNGAVNEYDAALILQKSVRKIDIFPIGTAWIFAPAHQEVTVYTSSTAVEFTAICIGDVDGSYQGGAN